MIARMILIILLWAGLAEAGCTPQILWWSCLVPPWYDTHAVYNVSQCGSQPVEIPAGYFAGVTDMGMADKHIVYVEGAYSSPSLNQYWTFRNSYMSIGGLPTVSSHNPVLHFSRPFLFIAGNLIGEGHFINAMFEEQNFNGWVLFWLSKDPLFRDCR